jgi:hypothetical protein
MLYVPACIFAELYIVCLSLLMSITTGDVLVLFIKLIFKLSSVDETRGKGPGRS